jgi:predicted dehydrogenase
VLCEKPISNSIANAFEMVQTAERHNKILAVNMNHRFTPAARIAKQWQLDNRIGTPLFINMSIWIHNPNESSPFFHIKALHPHSIDIMRHFFGDIEQVHCFAMKGPNRKIWSNAQFNIKFKEGAVGSLTGSYDIQRGHPMERCEFAGINGRVVIDDMYREATLYPAGDLVKSVYTNPIFGGMESFTDTFVNRINHLVDEIDRNVAPQDIDGSGLDGLKAQVALEAAVQSILQEKVVRTDDVLKI